MTAIKCSIVIPHYDQVNHLEGCLNAIQTLDADITFEVVIIDNGTKSTAYQLLKNKFPHFNFIEQLESRNPYTSRNKGIAVSKGDYIAFLDAKCRPREDWLKHLLQFEKTSSEIRAGSYILNYPSDHLKDKVYGILYLNTERNVKNNYGVTAGNLVVHKNAFKKVGLFKDDTISGNDIEWSRRALRMGYAIDYVKEAEVDYPSQSWSILSDKIRKYAEGVKDYNDDIDQPDIRQLIVLRYFLPLRWSTMQEGIRHRQLDHLSHLQRVHLWLLSWMMKIKFARAYKAK